MVRGWYHNLHSSQRVLSLQEVAAVCCSTSQKVNDWLAGKIFTSTRTNEYLVNASEVVSFLVRNSRPIPPMLLPPETIKILFMAANECEFLDREDHFDVICRYFAEQCSVLVETSTLGKSADLFPLTFSPDVVVIFIEFINKCVIDTIVSLSNHHRSLRTILLVDDSVRGAAAKDLPALSHHLVVSNSSSVIQLNDQLRLVFDN